MGRLGAWETRGGAGTGLHPSCLDIRLPGATFGVQPLVLSFVSSENRKKLSSGTFILSNVGALRFSHTSSSLKREPDGALLGWGVAALA